MYKKILTLLLMNSSVHIASASNQSVDTTHAQEINLRQIFDTAENDEKYDAAYKLWVFGSLSDQDYIKPFLLGSARDRNSAYQHDAAALLWEKGTEADKESIIDILLEIAKKSDGWNLVSHLKNNRDLLVAITQSDNNQYRYRAAEKLLKIGTEAHKKIAIPRLIKFSYTGYGWGHIINIPNNHDLLRQIAKEQPEHPHKEDALLLLWKAGTPEEQEEIRAQLLQNNDPSNSHLSYQFYSKVNESIKTQFLEHDSSVSLLNQIFNTVNHRWRFSAATALWNRQIPESKEHIKAFLIEHASRIEKGSFFSGWSSFLGELQHKEEILIAIAETVDHPFQAEAIAELYKSAIAETQIDLHKTDAQAESEKQQKERNKKHALTIFVELSKNKVHWQNIINKINESGLFAPIAEISNHPFQYHAAKKLWQSNQQEFKAIGQSIIIKMAETQDSPYKYDALEDLRNSNDTNHQETATALWCLYSQTIEGWSKLTTLHEKERHYVHGSFKRIKDILTEILKIQNHPYIYDSALLLWESNDEKDKSSARTILISIAKTPTHRHRYDAATKLWWESYDHEARNNAKTILIEIANTNDNPRQHDAIKLLWDSYDQEIIEATIPLWCNYARTPQGWNDFTDVIKVEFRHRNKSAFLKKILESIFYEQDHPHQFDAAEKIFSLKTQFNDSKLRTEIQQFFNNILLEQKNHPRYYDAAISILPELIMNKIRNKTTIQEIVDNLKRLMNTQDHPHRYETALYLYTSDSYNDPNSAKEVIIEIANSPHDPHQYDAAIKLWRSRFDQVVARPIIREIASTEGHPKQEDAIKALRESNNREDQELGQELKLRYFPVELMPETTNKRNQFNLSAIREMMPQRLLDLSQDPIDIVAEVRDLINLISADEFTANDQPNPYYLNPKTITGSDAHYTFQEIKNRALGFLKTLTGQTHLPGEPSGWDMYEESKPDMINTIKHLIYAIKRKLDREQHSTEYDPQGALLNLGVVLNGLLYCPTGQAEGLQTAVNTLINFKNIQSSDIREKIGHTVIARTVIDAFNHAFYQRGDVHGISRARMALNPELNISNALPAFKERISPPTENEKPEFYNLFYARFTIANILSEFHRNFQTPEEHEYISIHNNLDARRLKEQKPLHLGQIIEWLVNQRVSVEQMHEDFDISHDFTEITDYGIMQVLIKMNFFRKDSEEFIRYMRIITDRRINQLNERALKEEEKTRQKQEKIRRELEKARQEEENARQEREQMTREEGYTKQRQARPPLTAEEMKAARVAKFATPAKSQPQAYSER